MNKIIDIIKKHKNPYPKHIFLWNNKEKINITRGVFNKFIYSIVENTRQDIIHDILTSDIEKEEDNE